MVTLIPVTVGQDKTFHLVPLRTQEKASHPDPAMLPLILRTPTKLKPGTEYVGVDWVD